MYCINKHMSWHRIKKLIMKTFWKRNRCLFYIDGKHQGQAFLVQMTIREYLAENSNFMQSTKLKDRSQAKDQVNQRQRTQNPLESRSLQPVDQQLSLPSILKGRVEKKREWDEAKQNRSAGNWPQQGRAGKWMGKWGGICWRGAWSKVLLWSQASV